MLEVIIFTRRQLIDKGLNNCIIKLLCHLQWVDWVASSENRECLLFNRVYVICNGIGSHGSSSIVAMGHSKVEKQVTESHVGYPCSFFIIHCCLIGFYHCTQVPNISLMSSLIVWFIDIWYFYYSWHGILCCFSTRRMECCLSLDNMFEI